jgi:Ni/Co efflux regulator RcnB
MPTAKAYKTADLYLTEDEKEFFDALDDWLNSNRKWDKHPHWQQHHDAFNGLLNRAAHRNLTESGHWATGEPYDDAYKPDAELDLEPLIQLLMDDLQQDNILDAITRKY